MKIDLTCPVELWRYELPTETEDACRLLLYNLSDKIVTSMQVTLAGYDANGEISSRQVERLQDVSGETKSTFEVLIPMEGGAQAAGMELVIEKVWFDDGTIWRRGNAHLSEYVPNTLPNNRRLEMLRFVAGPDAVGYPQDQGALWLCVCGRANAASETSCRRCQREKLEVFEKFNQAAIEEMVEAREKELDQIAHRARLQASQQQLEREARIKRKQRRRRRVVLTTLITVVVLGGAYGIYFHGIPYYRYYRASQQLNGGLYVEAREAFAQMPGYLDADALIVKSNYLQASNNLKIGTEASLISAQDMFDKLGDYQDSVLKAKETRYARADKMLQAGSFNDAAALFEEIPDFANARVRRQEALFAKAKNLFEQGSFSEAKAIFEQLTDYARAADMAKECIYKPGIIALDNKEYDKAIELLTQIPDYPGVDQKLQVAYYAKGEQLQAAKDYVAAGEAYLKAGKYLDATAKASGSIYEPAKKEMEAGNFGKAADMFLKIKDYKDSMDLASECIYRVALTALVNKEYANARELFLQIPNHLDAKDLANEAIYLPAQELVKQGKFEEALTEFAKIPDYKDVSAKVQEVKYKQASAHMAAGEFDSAIALYQELGSYSDSATRIQDALYSLAGQTLEAKDYLAAIDQYAALNGYSDSDEKIKDAKYQLAMGHKEKAEYQEAVTLLNSLGKYKDAQDQLKACNYAQAKIWLDAGELDKAAAAFQELGKYEDAQTLFMQSNYEVAVKARDAGDLANAGRLFAQVSGYQDANAQSEACFDGYYAQVKADADAAMEGKDYKAVVDILSKVELKDLPQKYKDLGEMYSLANYEYANDLYAEGKPYEALPYYKNIPDYKDVTKKRLARNCYLVLGKWTSKTGVSMEFREDGTCLIDGEELFFNVSGTYSMLTGVTKDRLTLTHKVTAVYEKDMTLRDIRDGKNKVIKLTRVE
jgi:tetratricopeptide (TPR) repeat protein